MTYSQCCESNTSKCNDAFTAAVSVECNDVFITAVSVKRNDVFTTRQVVTKQHYRTVTLLHTTAKCATEVRK